MTIYARVFDDGSIVAPYRVPDTSDDGRQDLRSKDPALLASFGYYELVIVPKPDDTATTTHDRTLELVDGVPVIVWTPRPWTAAQLAQRALRAERAVKRARVENAVTTLRQWADDADNTTVQNNNAVQVLGTVVTRLGIFFDRFADLIEADQ